MSNGGLQLLPETRKRIEIKVPGQNKQIYKSLALLGVVLVIVLGLNTYAKNLESQIAEVDAQIVAQEKTRDKSKEAELLIFKNQAAQISSILSDHIHWTKALSKIESKIQPEVRLTSMKTNFEQSKVEMKGISPSYIVLARQISSFMTDDSISDVTLGAVKVGVTGALDFSLSLNYNKTKFLTDK